MEFSVDPQVRSKYNLLDYRLKNQKSDKVRLRCPADLPRDVIARLRTGQAGRQALSIRDVARIDFRLAEDGRIYFLEVNALPALDPAASFFVAARREGLSFGDTINAVLSSAAVRWKLLPSVSAKPKASLKGENCASVLPTTSSVRAAKPWAMPRPNTIHRRQLRRLLRRSSRFGHEVVQLEANGELPTRLKDAQVDLVFNIAEGVSGRNREAQVPALCELCGIPYTGSDAATLSLALDKALTKRLLKQRNINTPEFQVFHTGREKISPTLRFPLIVKADCGRFQQRNRRQKSVVDDVATLRKVVLELIQKYRQPALVEEYVTGREFTVGLLGERRPRILPPMEIVFNDHSDKRPVYDYTYKRDWDSRVSYQCPAKLSPKELKAVEKAALDTFLALDCRDVGRVDLRMDAHGNVYVLELNPLPGLTPDWSDLVLIGKAINMDHRTLIAEIMAGGLKRLREKKRGALPPRNGKSNESKSSVSSPSTGCAAKMVTPQPRLQSTRCRRPMRSLAKKPQPVPSRVPKDRPAAVPPLLLTSRLGDVAAFRYRSVSV